MADPTLLQGYEEAGALVRTRDPDRYLATLFAPEPTRPALFALYAFDVEIARIRAIVSEPLPGEVRIQWWRDTIERAEANDTPHPLARALLTTVERYRLPKQALLDCLDARIFDLYDDLMPSWADLEGYCGETTGAMVRLATFILADGNDPGAAAACGHAGVALGMMRIMRELGPDARRGVVFLPEESLKSVNIRRADIVTGMTLPEFGRIIGELRSRIAQQVAAVGEYRGVITPALRPAFLPLASIPLYLRQTDRRADDPLGPAINLANWRRIIAMLRWG